MRAVVGVDIGSLTAKTAVMGLDGVLLAHCIVQRGIVDEAAAKLSLNRALRAAGVRRKEVGFIVTTGYGRSMVKFGDMNMTEISCHGRGAHFLFPGVRTVIDIGGQDSKCIALDGQGRVVNFVMNDKCAAGTGRFIEVMARALRVPLASMGTLSQQSRQPAAVSSLCTVFAESEVISLVSKGQATSDIVAGIHEAIGRRMLALTKSVGLTPPVVMSGGVAKNEGVRRVLERLIGHSIAVAEEPQVVGAIGAALYALDQVQS